jgi:hypothetical protein
LRLFLASAACVPIAPIGPVLSALPDPDGDGSYLRLHAQWPDACIPAGTYVLTAVWGNMACDTPTAGFTNCISINDRHWEWGVGDDGTLESGWVVQFPAGSSDYFNNNFGPPDRCVDGVTELVIAPFDFVTAVPAFPTSGISNANYGLDPTGNTPEMSGPGVLATVSPFTFPSGTFATTSDQYIHHAVSVPRSALGADVHGWVQFPPGEPGYLTVGAEEASSNPAITSLFTLDGYTTPAVSFFVTWGIRLTQN